MTQAELYLKAIRTYGLPKNLNQQEVNEAIVNG
jgi:hypothetical protein